MTAKEIVRLTPIDRLALEAKARVGDVQAIRDHVLSAAWQAIQKEKGLARKERSPAFRALCRMTRIAVETA